LNFSECRGKKGKSKKNSQKAGGQGETESFVLTGNAGEDGRTGEVPSQQTDGQPNNNN